MKLLPVEKGMERLKLFGELKSLQSRKLNPRIEKKESVYIMGEDIARIYFRASVHGP